MRLTFACYADDSILYKARYNVDAVVEILTMSAKKLFKWFKDNQMTGTTDKYHLILSVGDSNQIQLELLIHRFTGYLRFIAILIIAD